LAIHRADEVLARIDPCLFGDALRRDALTALADGGSVTALDERASPQVSALLHRLAVEPSDADATDVLGGLARRASDRALRDLQRAARQAPDEQRAQYAQAIAWLKVVSERLSESDTREAAVAELLPWLIRHGKGAAA